MKNILKIIIISIILVSCNNDNFLDVIPNGTLIPQTVEDFDMLLEDPFVTYGVWTNLNYMDPDLYMSDLTYNGLTDMERQLQYEWDESPYGLTEDDKDWIDRYKYIYIFNLIISEIDNADLGNRTESDRSRVKGEAYAQRAFEYFILVNEYAHQYSSSNLDLAGVPLSLEIDLDAKLSRATIGEVYDQIEKDLDVAEPLLLENAENYNETANFRPGIASLYGLKALVALHKGEFGSAVTFSDKSLEYYDYLYDYNTFSLVIPGDPWSGLTIQDFEGNYDNMECIWNRNLKQAHFNPASLYSPALADLYDKTNDLRWTLFSSQTNINGVDVSPNFCFAAFNYYTQSGISTPNIYLINAEAKVRTGDGSGAITILNTLMEKRIANFTPLTYVDDQTTLQRIKEERRKELRMTGNNLIDLKRYHAYGEVIDTYTRTNPSGEVFTLEPGSDKYVVPISEKIKLINPNLN